MNNSAVLNYKGDNLRHSSDFVVFLSASILT